MSKILDELNEFAIKHKVILVERGEVGFGRPCVGFAREEAYIDFNPYDHETFDEMFPNDEGLYAPDSVKDAYHKNDCMAVLVHDENYEEALRQLSLWVDYLETVDVRLFRYRNGYTSPINIMFHGTHSWAFRRVRDIEVNEGIE